MLELMAPNRSVKSSKLKIEDIVEKFQNNEALETLLPVPGAVLPL